MNASVQAPVGLPLVALVGRPNVGKSALFNRIVKRRKAIVQDFPGTTRDRNYAETEWRGCAFRIVDTGGLLGEQLTGDYAEGVGAQVHQALAEADAICFVVDAQAGLLPVDEDVATVLRGASQPVYVVVNKADNENIGIAANEFHALGLGTPEPVSAQHGLGVAELLDRIVEWLPQITLEHPAIDCRLAIIGRPNVGKSSIINAILGEPRMIVSNIPGTTRDAVDTAVEFEGKSLVLVDTAGVRRRGRVERGVERASVNRARDAIARADVAAIVLDGGEDIAAQDQHILGVALDAYAGIVLVVNKSDLLQGDEELLHRRQRQLRWRARFVPWAPVVWTSALSGAELDALLRTAVAVTAQRRQRVSTGKLNALIKRCTIDHPPATYRGRPVKIFYATQAEVEPPTFVFFVNYPEAIHFSYERYLLRRIREELGFEGAALRLNFRQRSSAAEETDRA